MSGNARAAIGFGVVAAALLSIGLGQSWSVSLAVLNLCLISAVMALGVNIQWGYAGLFNVGTMAFAALGGLAAVVVSQPPVHEAVSAGGASLLLAAGVACLTVALIWLACQRLPAGALRTAAVAVAALVGYFSISAFFNPAVEAIEAIDPSSTGYLGGLGLPIVMSWAVGGLFAGSAAWAIGRVALGLRADYFAIATLGISEIVIAVLKNEDWLARGVKNVTGLDRPVPYEIGLQRADWFQDLVHSLNRDRLAALTESESAALLRELVVEASGIFVKLCYAGLFAAVLLVVLLLSERALRSPWGRMMRAIRDNETAAEALGKDVYRRHMQVFVLGSAVVGVAGAMLVTLDGQFTPTSYIPLRFTFLIWVMVIVGGSGNNLGAVLGGFIVWLSWIEAEPVALWAVATLTAAMAPDDPFRVHLVEAAAHVRPILMGVILLLVMRFTPRGVVPETVGRQRPLSS
ncbi:MAG: branched-chain amino acid ABC transporter permease [Rhodospirillales bacterium]|nr:branched-chain amino acid ABC transporter permease [Rhodospirillales bacterium]